MIEQPLARFALIGDSQYAERPGIEGRDYSGVLARHRELIALLNRIDLDFVVNLGDLGDGISRDEIPLLLEESCARSRHPFRHVVGNHDFVLRSEEELRRLFGLDNLFYHFDVGGIRFLVLNALDVSRFAPSGSERYAAYLRYKEEHSGILLREWDGMLSAASHFWLRRSLEECAVLGRTAVILTHIPVWHEATGGNTQMWDHQEILALLDDFPCVRALFAGHYHPGGIALRNGVLHKTVRALCNCERPTATVCRMFPDRIELEGIGDESSFLFRYSSGPAVVSGTTAPGAYVVAATGEIVRADDAGAFRLELAVPGVCALKSAAEGYDDAFAPMVNAPAEGIRLPMRENQRRKLYHGATAPFDTLRITDGGNPVRFFDLAGIPYGGLEPEGAVWHEHSDHYWCRGEYAFTAENKVRISALPDHPGPRARGWYKGDFHAHIVHGENLYRVNLPLAAFAARAEHYDWMVFSSDYANDGEITDNYRLAEALSGPDFLLKLNTEFPKNANGHTGNLGVEPVYLESAPDRVSNLELAQRYIADRGGVAVPVHPLYAGGTRRDALGVYDNMLNKEVFLWLLCAPELCPCLDLFYNDDTPGALAYWYMLLNRGYRIGCAATSDAALDLGRSPGSSRGATFVFMKQLNEKELIAGFRRRRTMVSWHGGVLLMSIGDAMPGDIAEPGPEPRKLRFETWYRPGAEIRIELIRNGELYASYKRKLPKSGYCSIGEELVELENAWYLALLYDRSRPDRILSAVSPVFFRNAAFRLPKTYPYPARLSPEFRMRMRSATFDELRSEAFFDEIAGRLVRVL